MFYAIILFFFGVLILTLGFQSGKKANTVAFISIFLLTGLWVLLVYWVRRSNFVSTRVKPSGRFSGPETNGVAPIDLHNYVCAVRKHDDEQKKLTNSVVYVLDPNNPEYYQQIITALRFVKGLPAHQTEIAMHLCGVGTKKKTVLETAVHLKADTVEVWEVLQIIREVQHGDFTSRS